MNARGVTSMDTLLSVARENMPAGKLKDLANIVDATQAKFLIPASQRKSCEEQIREYWGDKIPLPQDVALAMLLVMLHRTDIRRRRSGPSLFEESDEEESIVAANDAVYEAAIFQLFHKYDQPYYFGINSVCDASSENAEQFLRLSADLVEAMATQLARSKAANLTPSTQHKLLRESGARIMEKWNFPQISAVRRIARCIAELCLKKSLEPNGSVIANAYGIPQIEFDNLAKSSPDLARALQFAVAYNAITLVPRHSCKNKEWCLLELGGVALLNYGLTLKRGGFIEGSTAKLRKFVTENPA
jgi:hypothetical protein